MTKLNILILDDHTLFRAGIVSLLKEIPTINHLNEAGTIAEALHFLEKNGYSLLLLDISLDGESGLSLIPILRQKHPDLKIVILSTYKNIEYCRHALKAGASGYLPKDDTFVLLLQAIERVMSGQIFVSPTINDLVVEKYFDQREEPDKNTLELLTKTERLILSLIVKGLSNKEIGSRLHISPRTVETHRAHIHRKTGVKNTASLVRFALNNGLGNE